MKLKQSQTGIAHLLVLGLIVICLVIVGLVGYRVFSKNDENNKPASNSSESAKTDTLELQNVGLASMDSVHVTNEALRDYDNLGLKGFYPFGDKLGGTENARLNPNFEFSSLKPNTEVISAIDGVVAFIREQPDSGDYEVFIQPQEGSIWTIGYDHIANVVVKKGDSIKAGDVIGQPAAQGNGALRFEFQVNKNQSGTTTHVCPSTLLASGVKDQVLAELTAMQQAGNTLAGQNLYDLSAQNPSGCLLPTLSVAQAEGR